MRDYLHLNESVSAIDTVMSVTLNGKSEDEAQAYILSELKVVGMVDKSTYPDVDSYVDYIIDYCYGRDLYPDFISSKEVKEKKNNETGKVESGYDFIIFEFHYLGQDNKKEESISTGVRIDDDGNTYSLSLYFY